MKVLTSVELRARLLCDGKDSYDLSPDVALTQEARDYAREHRIAISWRSDADAAGDTPMITGQEDGPVAEDNGEFVERYTIPGIGENEKFFILVPHEGQNSVYIDGRTGRRYNRKPTNVTHLSGNIFVPRNNPHIAFRGKLESLESQIMLLQVITDETDNRRLQTAMEDVLAFVRQIMSAELLNRKIENVQILGADRKKIDYEYHHIMKIYGIPHPMPDYTMGRTCIELNRLRTFVRETEVNAAQTYLDGNDCSRQDIMDAMSMLSNAVYILLCRQLTGKWPRTEVTGELPGFLVEASGRHVHLTDEAVMTLFGEPLHKKKALTQPGQFSSEERVKLRTPGGEISHVIVLGPARDAVQVEISLTDARTLGIKIPINMSGDLTGAADVTLVGPKGVYEARQSVIASRAHIHMTPKDADFYGVEDGESVSVRLETDRPMTLDDVVVRVSEKYALAMHIDYDEANACLLKTGDLGHIIR